MNPIAKSDWKEKGKKLLYLQHIFSIGDTYDEYNFFSEDNLSHPLSSSIIFNVELLIFQVFEEKSQNLY